MEGFEECVQIVVLSINDKNYKYFTDMDAAIKYRDKIEQTVYKIRPGNTIEIGLVPVYKYTGE